MGANKYKKIFLVVYARSVGSEFSEMSRVAIATCVALDIVTKGKRMAKREISPQGDLSPLSAGEKV